MKQMYFITAALLIISCNQQSKQSDIKAFIPGEYVYEGGNEFSKGIDTLEINAFDEKGGTFTITRKTGYSRIVDGNLQPKEFKTEKILATYDEKKHQLQDTKAGRLFSFNDTKNGLLFGTTFYNKIK